MMLRSPDQWIGKPLGFVLFLLPMLLYGIPHFQRPPRILEERSLFQGIEYRRDIRSVPRPIVIHQVKIDLTASGLRPLVTPSSGLANGMESTAQTTSSFLQQHRLQLAVNANFFFPFREKTPWDYYPHQGDPVNLIGQAISQGARSSPPDEKNRPALCFAQSNQAQIQGDGICPSDTVQAVAGNALLVWQGKSVLESQSIRNDDEPYSRVAVALDREGETLWIIAVDGKQIFYSEGIRPVELTDLLLSLGVDAAITLDGGGSTSLVIETPHGTELLNAPIHTKIPMQERPVGNHLGFYARPD